MFNSASLYIAKIGTRAVYRHLKEYKTFGLPKVNLLPSIIFCFIITLHKNILYISVLYQSDLKSVAQLSPKSIVNSLQICSFIRCQHLKRYQGDCDLAFYALLPLFRSNKILLKWYSDESCRRICRSQCRNCGCCHCGTVAAVNQRLDDIKIKF